MGPGLATVPVLATCAADQRLERAIGADGVGQDQAGRVDTLPGIDQVDVLGAGVDIAQILSAGRNGRVLRQGQLAAAVRIHEDRLRWDRRRFRCPFRWCRYTSYSEPRKN